MCKITILTDNNTITDKYLLGEPALSVLIEAEGKNILFDTGYSDVFLKNAQKLEKDLKNIDYVVLSHGHNDHTGGLKYIFDLFENAINKPEIIACPGVFAQRYDDIDGEFGSPVEKESIEAAFDVQYYDKPDFITENIVFLGQIPRNNSFEAQKPLGLLKKNDLPDYVLDDSALAINTKVGIIIITGCSHSGIANICEYAKQICKTDKICSIIGGLHLKNVSECQLDFTVKYLKNLNLETLYACHCTGFQAQCRLNAEINLQETGAGLEIKF